MKLRLPVFILAGICAAASQLRAQTAFTWIGFSDDVMSIATSANWQGGALPAIDGTKDLIFGDIGGPQTSLLIDVPVSPTPPDPFAFRDITFNGSARPQYQFTGNGTNSFLQLNGNMTVGAGGDVVFLSGLQLILGDGAHIIDVANGVTVDSQATLAGNGSLVKTGTGTLIFRAYAVHQGGTTIQNGTLDVREATFGSSEGDIVVGLDNLDVGKLKVGAGSNVSSKNFMVAYSFGSEGSVELASGSSRVIVDQTAYIGKGGEGTLTVSGGASFTSDAAIIGLFAGSSGTVLVTSSNWLNYNGLIIGDAGIGELRVSDAGINSGDVTLGSQAGSTGLLHITGSGSNFISSGISLIVGDVGTGTLTLIDSGRLDIGDGTGNVILGASGGMGTLNIGAAAAGTAAPAGILAAGLVTTAGRDGGGSGVVNFNTTATSGSPYYFTDDSSAGGNPIGIEGNIQLLNTNGYNVLLAAATHARGTKITGGTLAIDFDNALAASSDVYLLATAGTTAALDLGNRSQTIANLTLGGADATSLARVNLGAEGMLTVAGAITFLGAGTTVDGFTAGHAQGALIAGGHLLLTGNRTFSIANSTTAPIDLSISSMIEGTGGIIKTGAGTLQFTGSNNYAGSTTVSGGFLMISADNNLGAAPASPTPGHLTLSGGSALQFTSSFTLNANRGVSFDTGGGTLIVDSGVALTYGGIMAGTGAFTKTGTGILVLSGQSTHSGTVLVNGGSIRLGTNNALSSGTALTLSSQTAANAVLDLNGFSQSLSSLTLGGSTTGSSSLVNIGAGGTLALTSITFNAANNPLGATIDGGTLTFSSPLGITVGDSTPAAFDLAISSNITGSGGLVKSGAGALALLGTGSYSGGTTINAGRVALGAVNALPIGGNVLIAALPTGTTRLDLGTYSQSIGSLEFRGGTSTSTGTLTIDSGAALSLSGNLTYTATNNPAGATLVGVGGTPGTLNLGSTSHIFDIGNSTNAAFDLTISAPITGSGGGFTKNGAGMLYLPGVNTYTGATILNAGTVYIDADSALGTAPGTPTPGHLQFDGGTLYNFNSFTLNANRGVSLGGSGGTFQVDSGGTLTYGGIIAGAGGLTKTGTGSLSLSGANTYSGFTTATAGTLSLTASNALPVNNTVVLAPVSPSGSALLQLNGTSQAVTALTLGGGAANSTSTVNIGTGGVLAMSSTLTYNQNNNPAGASITGGTLLLGANLQFSVGDSTATASDLTISSSISGAGFGFTKTGTGTLVLSGVNVFTGGMTVSDGAVRLAANTLGGQNVVINKVGPGGTAAMTVDAGTSQSIGSLTFGGLTAGSATTNILTLGAAATVTLGGNVTYDATANPLSAAILNGTVALGATRTFAINDSTGTVNELTVSAAISGAGFGITKTGTGVLALTGTNTFSGATSVFNGTLQIAADSGLGAAPGTPTPSQLVIDGGTLQNTATMALSTNRGINLGSGAGNFNTAAGTTLAYGGIIAGPGALIKSGTGTLTLAGANSYSGGTTLVNGKLTVSHPAALGSGTINFNGGELVVTPGITLSNTLNFTGSGGRIGGNGTFASAVSAGPNVTLAPGTSPGLTTFTGALTWATGGSYDFEVMTANGSAGTGYDSINVTGAGSFAITATSGGKFNLNLLSLSNATTPGNVSDFLSTGTYSWQIASSVNPITGFSASAFNINTSGFTNSLGVGSFNVSINGANTAIFLNFSPIPEPSTYALMAAGAGALLLTTRRRRRS